MQISKISLMFIFLFNILFLFGCKNNGRIDNESLVVKFPIKANLDTKKQNWKFEKSDSVHNNIGGFLEVKNIKRIYINDIKISGNFTVKLIDNHTNTTNLQDHRFIYLDIPLSKKKLMEFYEAFLNQNIILYGFKKDYAYQKKVVEWVDVENKVLYVFDFTNNEISVESLSYLYENVSKRLSFPFNGKYLNKLKQ